MSYTDERRITMSYAVIESDASPSQYWNEDNQIWTDLHNATIYTDQLSALEVITADRLEGWMFNAENIALLHEVDNLKALTSETLEVAFVENQPSALLIGSNFIWSVTVEVLPTEIRAHTKETAAEWGTGIEA